VTWGGIIVFALIWLAASASIALFELWKTWWVLMVLSAVGPLVALVVLTSADTSGPGMLGAGILLAFWYVIIFLGLVIGAIVALIARSTKSPEPEKAAK
jgi:hypothetical protein